MAIMALRATNSLSFDPHRISKQPSAPTVATKAQPSSGLSAIESQLAGISAKVEAQGKAKDEKTFGASLDLYGKIKAETRNEPIEDIKADDLFGANHRFGQFVGLHRKLDEIKTEDVIAWLDAQKDQRSKQTNEIGTGTRNRFVGSLLTFFDVAFSRGWALQNPAKGLRKSRRARSNERRASFTIGELHKLFTPELRAEAGRGFPERWWVPCFMLLNGTRTIEVCQIHLRDTVEIGGVACLRILAEDATQSTKTEEPDRVVPLHPQLIELGFLDYIADRRSATGGDPNAQVFPNLTFRKRFGYKTKLVNYFAGAKGHLQRIGIREEAKRTLHRLRHTSITAMERAGV